MVSSPLVFSSREFFCVIHRGRNSLSQQRFSQYFTDCADLRNLKIWLQPRYVTYKYQIDLFLILSDARLLEGCGTL